MPVTHAIAMTIDATSGIPINVTRLLGGEGKVLALERMQAGSDAHSGGTSTPVKTLTAYCLCSGEMSPGLIDYWCRCGRFDSEPADV